MKNILTVLILLVSSLLYSQKGEFVNYYTHYKIMDENGVSSGWEEKNSIVTFNRGGISTKVLETPLPSLITFNDDPLRLIRALRFYITKGFKLSSEIERAMDNGGVISKFKVVVSQERVREELEKMFKHDTTKTIQLLSRVSQALIPEILDICFSNGMWLKPTTKAK